MNTPTGSKSFQKRNPHLFKPWTKTPISKDVVMFTPPKPPKRIRQSTKPILNKLEQEYFDRLNTIQGGILHAQAIRFSLCNGVTYCPDLFSLEWEIEGESTGPVAWEIKGRRAWDDAIVKIKVAAHEWPEIHWYLVWKDDSGTWQQQAILP